MAVFAENGVSAVAWRLRYDDPASAKRGFVSVARGVLRDESDGAKSGVVAEFFPRDQAERSARSGKVCHARSHRGAFAAVRKGTDVVLVAGPFAAAGSSARPTADCKAALAWAAAVAKQR